MKITQALKAFLVQNCDVEPDATDAEFKAAAGEAFANGKLTAEKYTELTKDVGSDELEEFSEKFERIADGLEKAVELLTAQKETKTETKEEKKEPEGEKEKKPDGTKDKKPMSRMAKMMSGNLRESEEDDIEVRVKEAAESYSDTKSVLLYPTHTKAGRGHPFAGQPVSDYSEGGRAMSVPSDRDKAVVGAFGKYLCAVAQKKSRNLAWMGMPQHDKELICYAMEKMDWCGASDGGDYADIVRQKLTPTLQKALIDDATSGGVEAVPIVFDDMIIQTPILNGELFPLVNVVPLDKGRRVQGAAAGTVTGSWGGVDDTEITLFDTTSYVSSFDTTIFRWEGAVRIGLDFMSDTPIDFAQLLTQQYGEVLLNDLDDVVATGNGTTQPEGIMNKTGTTSVAWGGATSIGNYESLRFGVHKREHTANMARTAVFCGTDTSYQRALALSVGASDYRRLASTNQLPNYDGYSWMQRPYKVNESLTNAEIFYAILGRYRMYRRRGLTMRSSTEGDTLIRRNEMLMVGMARYGGQLERGAAAAKTSDAPA